MQKNNPILINVPHASTFIPDEERGLFVTPFVARELAVMTDHYCDDLYATGDTMLRFPVSRLVCDAERFRDDASEIMSEVGMGVIYTRCSDGSPLKTVTEEHKEELLRQYYDPYHARFEFLVSEKLREFDRCLIIDGHSFYPTPLPYELNQNLDRPDICLGTDPFHTPSELAEVAYEYFAGCGYSVAFNEPFAGSIVPLKYYERDKRVMSIMIELNRRLYMDADCRKSEEYERVKRDVAGVIARLENSAIIHC